MKNLLLTIAATFGMTALTMAQNVPNYVPTNGLVGWWPFNGNANDESGNGNNGINQNNVGYVQNRFGNANAALTFPNFNSKIWIPFDILGQYPCQQNHSFSFWVNLSINDLIGSSIAFANGRPPGQPGLNAWGVWDQSLSNNKFYGYYYNRTQVISLDSITTNQWHHLVYVYNLNQNRYTLYVDGIDFTDYSFPLVDNTWAGYSVSPTNGQCDQSLGNYYVGNTAYDNSKFNGSVDDLGVWNRDLTQQEITNLYNASICVNNTAISPGTNTINSGSTASFIATTSDPNPSYVWQSDFGQGYVNLNNYGNYSGTNTGTLNVVNVQLSEHNQPIRVITTSGNCIDTSNVAIISITDTCINTIIDTTLITVIDTLLINTTITGLNPPNNANTIKVFPNPTNDHITINYGNYSSMNGYQLKIENSLGQQVFQTNITQQSDYLNLTTWGGNGLYFVHIIDPQGNTIDIRKIVLQ